MTRIFTLARAATALLLVALVAGCGTARDEALPQVLRQLSARAAGQGPVGADAVRAQITPAFLAQVPQPLLLAEIPSRDALATLVPIGANGPWQSWASPDGVGLSLSQGLLGATRGLGYDLLVSDLGGVAAAIRAGQGNATRSHEFLDGANQVDRRQWSCSYEVTAPRETITLTGGAQHQTRRVREACRPVGPGEGFENTYWLGLSDGVIWQSRQWAGPLSGPVLLQQLRR